MGACKECGAPPQIIKSIRRLRREIERVTDRYNQMKESKNNEVAKRRALEKEIQRRENNALKHNERHRKVKAELEQVLLQLGHLQRSHKQLKRAHKETALKHKKDLAKTSSAVETLKKIRLALKSPA